MYFSGKRLSLLLLALFCAVSPVRAGNFYDTDLTELLGPAGTIIRMENMRGAPLGATAFRMLYRSRDRNGNAIAVSGVMIVPRTPAPPDGRPIVAWAHGTTGIARQCAPSLRETVFTRIPGLRELLTRGYIVTATDYPGLGTVGPHPYLVGLSEGRAVLDSVRAARNFVNASASDRFVLWGHSQGGHAVLFAGELAKTYAPELQLLGVATAAPATELTSLLELHLGSVTGKIFGSYALKAWSQVYGLSLSDIVLERSTLVFDHLAAFCNESIVQDVQMLLAEQPLEREGFLAADIMRTAPWPQLMQENTPRPKMRGIPVLIVQGADDEVVFPRITENFMRGLCSSGTSVSFVEIPGADHDESAIQGAPSAAKWIAARFDGRVPKNDCGLRKSSPLLSLSFPFLRD